MVEFLQTIDMKMFEYINKRCSSTLLDKIMPIVSLLGNFGIIWIMISLFLLDNTKYRFEGMMIICSIALSTIIGEGVIKHLVRRARPFTKMKLDKLLIAKPLTYSFPSGHSASSFAAAGILVAMNSWVSAVGIVFAAVMAFSRIYLKVHYPLDVIIGVLLGILCSIITMIIFL